ncbi:MAG: GerMN domain-containing protein [Anaerolineaceae bacterium]|jgi:hypothetical protein
MLKRSVYLFILVLLFASSCNIPLKLAANSTPATLTQPAPLAQTPTQTLLAPEATPLPAETFSPAPPTLTAVPPTFTPFPKTSAKTSTKSPKTTMLKIFLIAVNDNGVSGKLVGCGDSAVAVNIEVPYTTGVLRAALNKELSIKDKNYGQSGLYNVLYQSNLKTSSVSIKNGEAIIHLSGKLTLGGECDNPRVQAELEETALQFSTVKKVSIYINDVPLKKVLSLK